MQGQIHRDFVALAHVTAMQHLQIHIHIQQGCEKGIKERTTASNIQNLNVHARGGP